MRRSKGKDANVFVWSDEIFSHEKDDKDKNFQLKQYIKMMKDIKMIDTEGQDAKHIA